MNWLRTMDETVVKLYNCAIAHIDLAPTGRYIVAQGVTRSASPG